MAIALAKHTQFQTGDGTMSEAFTTVANCIVTTAPSGTWAVEDTTSSSSATPVTTSIQTLKTEGEVQLTVQFDPGNDQHALLRTQFVSGGYFNYKLIFVNSGETQAFQGFVKSFQKDTPVNGIEKAKITIVINGAVTIS